MKKTQVIVFMIGITTILFLAHLILYEGVLAVFNITSAWLITVLRIMLYLSPVGFIGLSVLSTKYNTFLNRNLYKANSIWLGFLHCLLYSTLVYGIIVGLFALTPSNYNTHEIGILLYVIGALVGVYGLAHARKIIPVSLNIKLANLPANWVGKKIVFVSDWHLGQVLGPDFARRVVDAVNKLNPEVVFIGGDLYDGVAIDEEAAIQPLKNLRARLGTYFITGNHDGFSYEAMVRDVHAIEKIGIKILQNQIVDLEGIQLIGIDYRTSANRDNYKTILQGLNIDRNRASIMLKHVPSDVDLAINAGVMFQISGHTHRAQMQPLSFVPRLVYKGYDYGLRKIGNFQEFTSSGVGTWGPPFRLGTNSEIVLITLG